MASAHVLHSDAFGLSVLPTAETSGTPDFPTQEIAHELVSNWKTDAAGRVGTQIALNHTSSIASMGGCLPNTPDPSNSRSPCVKKSAPRKPHAALTTMVSTVLFTSAWSSHNASAALLHMPGSQSRPGEGEEARKSRSR